MENYDNINPFPIAAYEEWRRFSYCRIGYSKTERLNNNETKGYKPDFCHTMPNCRYILYIGGDFSAI